MEFVAENDGLERELKNSARWARALALALVNDRDDADDLVQEAWTAAVRHRPSLQESLQPWLGKVMRNLAATSYRLRLRRRKREAMVDKLREPAESAEAHFVRVEIFERLGRFVKELDEPYRQTIVMRFLEERSSSEIARAMEIPEGTVRWRLKEGLARLRKRMDDEHEGESKRWRRALLPWVSMGQKPRPIPAPRRVAVIALTGGVALLTLLAWISFRGPSPDLKANSAFLQEPQAKQVPAHQGQVVPSPQSTNPLATAPHMLQEIRGCITEAGGGPIPGAEIRIIPSYATFGPVQSTRAKEDGCYRLQVPPGHYIFIVKASGYASEAGTLHRTQESARELNQKLIPGATVIGKVLASSGKPAEGVEVSAYVSGNFGEQLMETSRSSETGAFEIRDLRAGTTRVEARLGEWVGTALITTSVGERMVAPDLILRPGLTIGGVVLGPEHLPMAKARLWLRSEDGLTTLLRPHTLETNSDGSFAMKGLLPGRFGLTAQAPGYVTERRILNLEGHSLTTELVLRRGEVRSGQGKDAWLHGMVRWTDGTPAPSMGLDVFAAQESDKFRFVTTDGEGRFRLGPFGPGPVRVTATRRPSGELDPRFSSPKMTFLLKTGENRGPVELRIPRVGPPIAGRVRSPEGNPVAGAEVRGSLAFSGGSLHYSRVLAITDAEGRFRIDDLPQASGTLFVRHPAYAESVLDQVASGDSAVEIVLHPGITLSGIVRYQGRALASEAKVSLYLHEKFTRPIATGPGNSVPGLPTIVHQIRLLRQEKFMPGGGFSFPRIRPGKYTVLAQSGTQLVGVINAMELDSGRSMSQVTIDLDEGAVASGQIIEFGSGKPLHGIQIFANVSGERPSLAEVTTNEAGQFTLTGLPLGVRLTIQSQSMGRFIDEFSHIQFEEKGPIHSTPVALLRADQWERPSGAGSNHGLFLNFDDGMPTVSYIKADSAAARAGLQRGDRLRKINGVRVDGLLSQGIRTLLSGAPGTTVVLEIIRKNSQVPTEITLVRR